MGSAPNFCAIRFFDNPEGWVAQFSGDAIADHFPRLDKPNAEQLGRLRRQQQMGVNHRLKDDGSGSALILWHTIAHQQRSFQIGAFTQQIFHQWIGLEEVPLVIGGAIPKSLQGIGNGHNRSTIVERPMTRSIIKPPTKPWSISLNFFWTFPAIP